MKALGVIIGSALLLTACQTEHRPLDAPAAHIFSMTQSVRVAISDVAPKDLAFPPRPYVGWAWGNVNPAGLAVEVWRMDDCGPWRLDGVVFNGNCFYHFEATNGFGFYKIRSLDPITGLTSKWSGEP